jgi:hypothetical protein
MQKATALLSSPFVFVLLVVGSVVTKKKKTIVSITFFDGFVEKKMATCTYFGGFAPKKVTTVMSSLSFMVEHVKKAMVGGVFFLFFFVLMV